MLLFARHMPAPVLPRARLLLLAGVMAGVFIGGTIAATAVHLAKERVGKIWRYA